MTRMPIPWDEIDLEIRPAVEALCEFEGIVPGGLCAGHEPL